MGDARLPRFQSLTVFFGGLHWLRM
jgi:hypothetical protein